MNGCEEDDLHECALCDFYDYCDRRKDLERWQCEDGIERLSVMGDLEYNQRIAWKTW